MDNELRPLVNTRGGEGERGREREGERKGETERGERGGERGREREREGEGERERERERGRGRERERKRGGDLPRSKSKVATKRQGASSVCRDADDVDNLTSRICNQQQRQIPKCI